jgi:RND family efflux transporter MFP subunit
MTAHSEDNAKSSPTQGARRVLIAAVVLVAMGGGGYLLYQQRADAQPTDSPAASETAAAPQQRVSVVTTAAVIRDFDRSLLVQGNVEAKYFAMVSPRLGGAIETIDVDEGDAVTAGETKLFGLDAVALERNVEVNRHNLTVATCAKREALANLEKTKVDFHKAELDYHRFQRLREKEAVTQDAFEQQESRYQQLAAAVKLAEAQRDLASAQEAQVAAALAIAEKNLADATVYAPIDGKVSQRLQEPGEMGDPGVPVLRIDDTSVLEVTAFLPAEYYAAVIPGQTAMRIAVSGVDIGRQVITYKSPTIQPKLRSFEIKCLLKDPPAAVVPGAMAQLTVVLESRRGLGVPAKALEQRGGGTVVFVIENDTARQVPVTTGIETEGWMEIADGDLAEGAAVVTMGQYMVEGGTPVTVQKESN